MQNGSPFLISTRVIVYALALFVCASFALLPASTGIANAAGLGAGGVLGGVQAGIGVMARGTLGGAMSTLDANASASLDSLLGSSNELQVFGSETALDQLAAQLHVPKASIGSILTERAQIQRGTLMAASADLLKLRTDKGIKTFFTPTDEAAAASALIGTTVSVRSVDGIHASSIVGKHDVQRGTVVAVNDDTVTFVGASGEVHNITLTSGSAAKLGVRLGSDVAAISDDFEKTAAFGVITAKPSSVLGDVFSGQVTAVSKNSVAIRLARGTGTFITDSASARLLAGLRGKTIAFIAPDGSRIKALVTAGMLDQLLATATGQLQSKGGVLTQVMAASRNQLTLQLPNGDVVTYLLTKPLAQSRARAAVTLVPLDFVHARVLVGAAVLKAVDAAACVTVNSNCNSKPMTGTLVALAPASVSIRMADGDLRTFIGDVHGLGADIGVPVKVSALDGLHARVSAGQSAVNLVDARACVTINSGCDAEPGVVLSASADRTIVKLADGTQLDLRGSTNGVFLTASLPVIVQPLDNTHVALAVNGSALGLANASACATANAVCVASTSTTDSSTSAKPEGSVMRRSQQTTIAGAGNTLSVSAQDGGVLKSSTATAIPVGSFADVIAMASAATPLSQDGQIFVTVADSDTHKPLANAAVSLSGVVTAAWVTGKSGKITLVQVPAGYYTLTVAHAGYVPMRTRQFHVEGTTALAATARMTLAAQPTAVQTLHIAQVARKPATSLHASVGSVCVFQQPKANAGHPSQSAPIRHVFCTN